MHRGALAAGFLAGVLLAGQHPFAQQEALRTRAERSNYEDTSSYADVQQFVGALATSSVVHVEAFGRSEEGRDLPLIVISEPKVTTPAAARKLGRPIVLVQAAIHAGEIDGKEASLILARRLVDGDLKALARQLVILLAPLTNADGNEKVDLRNRSEQNGPFGGVGTRENGKGLDLNRDYVKLESAETRALVQVLNSWDPHVVVDLHTTNGSYHAYHLTYAPILNPNADLRLITFERETLLPTVRKALLDRHGFRSYYYGTFASEFGGGAERARVDPDNPGDAIWRTFDHRPRYGNNYVGLRNRIAVLSEAYSYLDSQARVAVTTAFVEQLWRACARHAARILTLTAQADRSLAARTRASKPLELGLEFQMQANVDPVTILVGDVSPRAHPISGQPMLQMTELVAPVPMREYGAFVATRTRPLPTGWIIPRGLATNQRMAAAFDRLRWHGITMERLNAATQMDVDRFVIQDLTRAEPDGQGHREVRLQVSMERAALSVDPDSMFIPATQPLARLAAYLLEPDSDDGLVTWNVMAEALAIGQGYPVYRVR